MTTRLPTHQQQTQRPMRLERCPLQQLQPWHIGALLTFASSGAFARSQGTSGIACNSHHSGSQKPCETKHMAGKQAGRPPQSGHATGSPLMVLWMPTSTPQAPKLP